MRTHQNTSPLLSVVRSHHETISALSLSHHHHHHHRRYDSKQSPQRASSYLHRSEYHNLHTTIDMIRYARDLYSWLSFILPIPILLNDERIRAHLHKLLLFYKKIIRTSRFSGVKAVTPTTMSGTAMYTLILNASNSRPELPAAIALSKSLFLLSLSSLSQTLARTPTLSHADDKILQRVRLSLNHPQSPGKHSRTPLSIDHRHRSEILKPPLLGSPGTYSKSSKRERGVTQNPARQATERASARVVVKYEGWIVCVYTCVLRCFEG